MAPEPDTLKRKRSRPSEWWAVSPSPANLQEQHSLEQKPEQRPKENKRANKHREQRSEGRSTEEVSKTAITPNTIPSTQQTSSKRKRSRPSDWWATTPSASLQGDEPASKKQYTPNTSVPKRSLKEISSAANRGAPLDINVTPVADGNAAAEGKSLKRGVESKDDMDLQNQGQDYENNSLPAKKKRGRPSGPRLEQKVAVNTSAHSQDGTRKKRGRLRKQPIIPDSQTNEKKRSRRRTGKSDVKTKEQASSSSTKNNPRQVEIPAVGEVVHVETASSTLSRARPKSERVVRTSIDKSKTPADSKNRKPPPDSATPKQSTEKPAQTKGRKPKRSSNADSVEKEDELPSAKRRRVHETSQEEENGHQMTENPLSYQHLAAVTRRVPRHAIEAKWEALPPNCVEHVSQLLADLQKPVIARHKDEHKRNQASTALQTISRRLVSKILKGLPFPPGTNRQREDDFNFEKLIDRSRVLNSQLTAAMDANKLLNNSLSSEMAMLESERVALSELETNAKADSRKRKQAERKIHPLLQPDGSAPDDGIDDTDSVGLVSHSVSPTLGVFEDKNMQAIVQELEGHAESMDGNLKQVRGITEAMRKTKAAVQVVLFDHLGRTRSEGVVLSAG